MKTKTLRSSISGLVVLLVLAPLVRAQDLSKYRHFTLGMSLTKLLERTDQTMTDVKMVYGRPALIQELTWWPPSVPGTSLRSDSVEQILFSFYNGALFKISVTYNRPSTEGLTDEDMVESVSAKYGPARIVAPEIDSPTSDRYNSKPKPVASWEDAEYSFSLVRSSFGDALGLVAFSKRANAQAEFAITEALKLDEQEGPKRDGERQKKQMDDLEVMRQKNQKSFRP
jgi:hypothetical protein